MLRDKLLTDRYRSYLDRLLRLGEGTDPRQSRSRAIGAGALYLSRFTELRALWRSLDSDFGRGVWSASRSRHSRTDYDLCDACPICRWCKAVGAAAQLIIAVRHRECFGRYPRGIWLPECGYVDGLDELLAELDLRYFFLDARTDVCATASAARAACADFHPRWRGGVWSRPDVIKAGVVVDGRLSRRRCVSGILSRHRL